MHVKESVALTNTGHHRDINEDASVIIEEVPLFAVADGMGGAGAGDVAAQRAVAFLRESAPVLVEHSQSVAADRSSGARLQLGELLDTVLCTIDEELEETAERLDLVAGMGTTLATAMVCGDHAYIAHIGDSRVYLYRDGRLRLITEDHTLAMLRYRQGKMTPEEYAASPMRRRLYQCLGAGGELDVDTAEVPVADDDILLLCTDGLHRFVSDGQIAACLQGNSLVESGQRLIAAALDMDTDDNVAVVLVRIGAERSSKRQDTIADILSGVFLFQKLSPVERNVLGPYLDQRVLKAGDALFYQGDPGDAFYVVVEGRVRITIGETPLTEVGPGGHFGELSLARPVPRSATVAAVEDTFVFCLTRDRFEEILARRPALGAKLTVALLDTVGDRLRDLTDRLQTVERVVRGDLRPDGMNAWDAVLAAAHGKLNSEGT